MNAGPKGLNLSNDGTTPRRLLPLEVKRRNGEVEFAVRTWEPYIAGETLATSVVYRAAAPDGGSEAQGDGGEGQSVSSSRCTVEIDEKAVTIGIRRVGN